MSAELAKPKPLYAPPKPPISPEHRAQIIAGARAIRAAQIEAEAFATPQAPVWPSPGAALPKPVLVCDRGRVVGNAVVIVSDGDFNWYRSDAWAVATNGEIQIRVGGKYDRVRPDRVRPRRSL